MRQIVQLNKLIVQTKGTEKHADATAPILSGLSGKADVFAWDGGDKTIAWELSEGFGYLLVTAGGLAATCATGKQTNLNQGDLLIMNEATSPRFTMTLAATQEQSSDAIGVGPSATARTGVLYGSMRADNTPWRAQPFAQAPTWAMAVLKPSTAECARLNALAQLLQAENNGSDKATRVVAGLQATLFEALSFTLGAYDPLSMPQLTAGIDAQLSRAITAMAIAPSKPWRVETMAQAAAMSRTAFALKFKAVLGRTPLDYLTALRIQHAVTLMSNPSHLSTIAIAKMVGYADESALRRAYLRVTGTALKKRENNNS
jgi:AraC-like DNA-binding protein